jgi:hypothetical protein
MMDVPFGKITRRAILVKERRKRKELFKQVGIIVSIGLAAYGIASLICPHAEKRIVEYARDLD